MVVCRQVVLATDDIALTGCRQRHYAAAAVVELPRNGTLQTVEGALDATAPRFKTCVFRRHRGILG
jgi:hypothetical protein